MKCTRDGKYVVATGTYKPQMRVFEFADMSMKFERHTDAETLNFEVKKGQEKTRFKLGTE